VDSEVMMGELVSRGHELTSRPDQAEVLVVNTCSFIDPAKKESIDTILEMAEYKRIGRARRLIVAGCLVERYRDDIRKDLPEVDAIIGTNELSQIIALCEDLPTTPNPFEPYLYHDLTPRVLSTPKHFAYIKIAEGCDHPCTFCVIPQYRGAFRSRRFESVIAEATRLFSQGVREISLIGQDTTCFGEDLGLTDGLAALLARLAQIETPREKWIRFLFSYSDEDSSRSFHLDGKVDGRAIHHRKRRLMAIQRKISKARNKRLVGQEVRVLVEGPSRETDLLWEARMPTQAPEIDGVTLINDYEGAAPRTGEIRRLRITESHDYDVLGTLLPETERRPSDLVNIHAGV
jgi:tRNA A37 methylthiotransferase MiaB